ncbi:MAG: ISNCY-like element ISFac3 family transposase, partial [Nitrososphaeria archaeon]
LLLKKKGIKQSDASGDGTGYSLTIKKNYESYANELKEKAKKNREENGKKGQNGEQAKKAFFAYSFRLMDLSVKMYVAWGSSMKSEKDAFEKAIHLLKTADVKLKSVRLDKYCSESAYMDYFDKETKVYVIPKKNSTLNLFRTQ